MTIFDDSENYNWVHKLLYEWDVWVNDIENAKSQNWLDKIKKVVTFNNVEDFWGIWNNVLSAEELITGSDYYYFKKDILPMWEDTSNKAGGKMTLILRKDYNDNFLNELWLNTILSCIGEQFTHSSIICGSILNIRKHQNRINIWVNTSDEETIMSFGKQWKELLKIHKMQISFIKHDDTSIQYIIK